MEQKSNADDLLDSYINRLDSLLAEIGDIKDKIAGLRSDIMHRRLHLPSHDANLKLQGGTTTVDNEHRSQAINRSSLPLIKDSLNTKDNHAQTIRPASDLGNKTPVYVISEFIKDYAEVGFRNDLVFRWESPEYGLTFSIHGSIFNVIINDNPKDVGESPVKFYKIMAERGESLCQAVLGHIYEWGRGVEVDYDEAFFWYQRSANQGNPLGMYMVGYSYVSEIGVEQDIEQARIWYERSYNNGYKPALVEIGNLDNW